jgi:hypothetical protein
MVSFIGTSCLIVVRRFAPASAQNISTPTAKTAQTRESCFRMRAVEKTLDVGLEQFFAESCEFAALFVGQFFLQL